MNAHAKCDQNIHRTKNKGTSVFLQEFGVALREEKQHITRAVIRHHDNIFNMLYLCCALAVARGGHARYCIGLHIFYVI